MGNCSIKLNKIIINIDEQYFLQLIYNILFLLPFTLHFVSKTISL